jgi:hypothetical protein
MVMLLSELNYWRTGPPSSTPRPSHPFRENRAFSSAKRHCNLKSKWCNIVIVAVTGFPWEMSCSPLCTCKQFNPGDKKIACETATLEVRLRSEGIVVTGLDKGGGVSVVQTLKNLRMGALQWYATLVACILFFGGFLLKSYWEDVVFERDMRRVLTFYRRAVPGSMRDGDENGARLWVRLEKKYEYYFTK